MLINGGPGETFNGIVTFFWRSCPPLFPEFIQHSYPAGGKISRPVGRQEVNDKRRRGCAMRGLTGWTAPYIRRCLSTAAKPESGAETMFCF